MTKSHIVDLGCGENCCIPSLSNLIMFTAVKKIANRLRFDGVSTNFPVQFLKHGACMYCMRTLTSTVWSVKCWLRRPVLASAKCNALTLIHPASPMHMATRWRHECPSWADASTFSQVNSILWGSFFATSLQFILGLPGLLLNPATSQCSACFGMRTSSILVTCPSHRTLLSPITFSRNICPLLFRILHC